MPRRPTAGPRAAATRWRGPRLLGALIASAVVATGCTAGDPGGADGGSSAVVEAGRDTTVRAAGITVTVPDGGAPEDAELGLATGVVDDDVVPAGVTVHGPAAVATLDGGELREPATVTFPVPAGIDGRHVVPVVLWEDRDGGWRWLPTRYEAGQDTVTATTDHFSTGFLGGIDIETWAEDRRQDLVDYVTGRAGVDQPSCGDEQGARAEGVEVSSDGGDSVKWCYGIESGRRVLKIANNRRTYTQVTFPSTWTVTGPPSLSLSPESINRALSTTLAGWTAPAGSTVRLVDGGDTLTLEVPEGGSGTALAEVSVYGWLLSALQFGVETYAAIAQVGGQALGQAAAGSWQRIRDRLVDVGAASEGYRDALAECGTAVSGLTETDLTSVGGDLLRFAWGCVPGLMKADIAETGVVVFAAGIVLSAIGAVVGFVLSAVHLLVTGIREIWDSIAGFGGNSDAFYDIELRRTSATCQDQTWDAPSLTMTSTCLGAVRLGMTFTDAVEAAGVPMDTSSTTPSCPVTGPAPGPDGRYPPLMLAADGDSGVFLLGTGNQGPIRATTPEGIGRGSTTDDVLRVYGHRAEEHVDIYGSDVIVVDAGNGTGYRFESFDGPGGELSAMQAGYLQVLDYTELCG